MGLHGWFYINSIVKLRLCHSNFSSIILLPNYKYKTVIKNTLFLCVYYGTWYDIDIHTIMLKEAKNEKRINWKDF